MGFRRVEVPSRPQQEITVPARQRRPVIVPAAPPPIIATYVLDIFVNDANFTKMHEVALNVLMGENSTETEARARLSSNNTIDVGECIKAILDFSRRSIVNLTGCQAEPAKVYLELSGEKAGYGQDDHG